MRCCCAPADVLLRYFDTATLDADLPLHAVGTAFQERVWRAIARIPCRRHV